MKTDISIKNIEKSTPDLYLNSKTFALLPCDVLSENNVSLFFKHTTLFKFFWGYMQPVQGIVIRLK